MRCNCCVFGGRQGTIQSIRSSGTNTKKEKSELSMSVNKPKRRTEDRPAWTPPTKQETSPVSTMRTTPRENPVGSASHAKERIAEVTIEEIPPHCPSCMSTDREKKNGTLVRNISGVSRDGRPFNRVKWTYCKCRACGQGYKVISRINTSDE